MNLLEVKLVVTNEVQPLFSSEEWAELQGNEVYLPASHLRILHKASDTGLERKKAAAALLISLDRLSECEEREGVEGMSYSFMHMKVYLDARKLLEQLAGTVEGNRLRAAIE